MPAASAVADVTKRYSASNTVTTVPGSVPMSHATKGGTAEEQHDSKLFMGKGKQAKMLAELDEIKKSCA